LRWYEIDFNWYGIRALQMFGLARSIRLISEQQIAMAAHHRVGELQKAA
jgi:fatty-acid desaturase